MMQPLAFDQVTVDEISSDELKEKNLSISVLRLDKIHPIISGNKWFKLKYYLEDAKQKNKDHIVTFGGAYSNHIVATAAAGKLYGLKTTGIIRGEKPSMMSHTLEQAIEFGMELIFISREDFRSKKIPDDFSNAYIINDGGYGELGAIGATEILSHCNKNKYTHFCCAVGTTTMMAGLVKASSPQQEVIGFPVLKNPNAELELQELLTEDDKKKKISFIHEYHFGGYAKQTRELIDFMNEFYQQTQIKTDFVYTAKLFYGVMDLIKKKFFPPNSKIMVTHSGGLQGNLSLPKDLLIF